MAMRCVICCSEEEEKIKALNLQLYTQYTNNLVNPTSTALEIISQTQCNSC